MPIFLNNKELSISQDDKIDLLLQLLNDPDLTLEVNKLMDNDLEEIEADKKFIKFVKSNPSIYTQSDIDKILRGEDPMDIMSLNTTNDYFCDLDEKVKNSKVEGALKVVINMILDSLTPELARSFILLCLDKLEEITKKTDNKVDDLVIGALCNKARDLLGARELKEETTEDVSEFIKEKADDYLKEIDFGQTDVMKALSNDVTSKFKETLKNPFEN